MNSFAAVVMMEKDDCSSGVPGRHVSHTPATLMMGSSWRWILNGRFRWPSFFHSKKPLRGRMQRCRMTRSRYSRLWKTPSLLAFIVESLVVNAGSVEGTNCQSHFIEFPESGHHAKN